jgi:hypothetical protein
MMEVLRFHDPAYPGPLDLDEFHEWNVGYAIDKFHNKPSNDEVVTFFNFHTKGGVTRILEAKHRNSNEKYTVFNLIRAMCAEPALRIEMVSHISEAWVIVTTKKGSDAMKEVGLQPRDMPDREDVLMVSTFHRNGDARLTRWVVKLKPDPRKNMMLARDDLDMSKGNLMGEAMYFFEPVRQPKENE